MATDTAPAAAGGLLALDQPLTQSEFGALVGISQPAVSDLVTSGAIAAGGTCREWLLAYTARLREQAAGRATGGDNELATERARLAREQADRVAMQNAERRRELAPIELLTACLASGSRQIAAALDAIPVNLRRRSSSIGRQDIEFVEGEIARARAMAMDFKLDWAELEGGGASPGDDADPAPNALPAP